MNESTHTAGMLALGKNGDHCAKNHALCAGPIVIVKVYGAGYPTGAGWAPRSEADARRLAACWNACAGIETADMESIGPGGIETKRQRRQQEKRLLRVALQDLIHGAEAMDARLIALTGSPKETERGDITRARQALIDCGYVLEDPAPASAPAARLEHLRGELRAERISYDGLSELQSLAQHIDPADTELLEAAGVPES